MKTRIIVAIVFFFGIIGSIQAQETASQMLDKASAQALKENKKVFVMFHASWCSWCHRMDNNMNSDACKKLFADNYVIVHITVQESPKNKSLETPGGAEVLAKYNGSKSGLPFWVIIDSKGALLADSNDAKGQNLGCPSTPEEVVVFIEKLKKTSKLSSGQLATISEKFTIKK